MRDRSRAQTVTAPSSFESVSFVHSNLPKLFFELVSFVFLRVPIALFV